MSLAFVTALFMLTGLAAQQDAARIEGIVVHQVTGQALARTTVDFFSDSRNPQVSYRMTTGEDGRFRFSNITPGTYRLVAVRGGSFLPTEYGQKDPRDKGRPLVLAPGQDISGIRLELTPTGTISGRVTTADGDPLVRGIVQALQTVKQAGGDTLTIVQSVPTNDRGEYRLFFLAPGSYYVTAKALGWGGSYVATPGVFGTRSEIYSTAIVDRVLPTGEAIREFARPVYYPDATAPENAKAIDLPGGADIQNINMISLSVRLPRITGTAAWPDPGRSSDGYVVQAWTNNGLTLPFRVSQGRVEQGRFILSGMLPGSYVLVVSVPDGEKRIPVEVGESDVENVQILLR